MSREAGRPGGDSSMIRKIGWTALAGFVTFAGAALLEDLLDVTRADQLILTAIVGAMTLLVQYLAEFEVRLQHSEELTKATLQEIHIAIRRGFTSVNEATALLDEIDRSALPRETLKQTVRHAGRITGATPRLVRELADSELQRLSDIVSALADGHEVYYEGEDREILLGLTRRATASIRATSWATASPYGVGFEAGFWLNDLGGRYLELQRAAIERGVKVQRVFLSESPDLIDGTDLRRVLMMQQKVGVEVRVRTGPVPLGYITDFVLFDDEVAYDTTPVTRGDMSFAPWLLTTRLGLERSLVHNRINRFDELWSEATDPGGVPSQPPMSP